MSDTNYPPVKKPEFYFLVAVFDIFDIFHLAILKGGKMANLRRFLGLEDIEYVALHAVFPESSVSLVSPVTSEERWPLVIIGPEHQINFLFPLIRKMLRESPLASDGEGWTGVNHVDAKRLNLFYVYSDEKPTKSSIVDERSKRMELLQSKFRNDAAKYADLKIAEVSVIEVVWDDNVALTDRVSLPRNFKNGNIVLPPIWLH